MVAILLSLLGCNADPATGDPADSGASGTGATPPIGTDTDATTSPIAEIPPDTFCIRVDADPEMCFTSSDLERVELESDDSYTSFTVEAMITYGGTYYGDYADFGTIYVGGTIPTGATLPRTVSEGGLTVPFFGVCEHDNTVDCGLGCYSCEREDDERFCSGSGGEPEGVIVTVHELGPDGVIATFETTGTGIVVQPCCSNDTLGCDSSDPTEWDNPGPHSVSGRLNLPF